MSVAKKCCLAGTLSLPQMSQQSPGPITGAALLERGALFVLWELGTQIDVVGFDLGI